jgi:tetratricopeptide (TPR) repeat protein
MRKPKTKLKPIPVSASVPVSPRSQIPVWLLVALLVLVTIALFWPATRFGFVNYDDNVYVTENPHVQGGLTWEGVKWALFSTEQAAYWAPVMWLSHMLACQFFGLNPWGHHLVNVLLHSLNVALVFLLFRRLSGATWRSFFVAALFGWHPLRVESVAWVAECKDMLSTFFGLLSLIFYVRFVQQQGARGKKQGAPVSLILSPYFWSLFFFALGLMSKPMLVTWPFVMLLLDYWPLKRFPISDFRFPIFRLVVEKLPFFALAAVMSTVTYITQKHGGAVMSIDNLPLDARCGNALISYCRYLEKLFWPANLAIFYPHRGYWPTGEVAAAGCLCAGMTALFLLVRRRYPFLLTGWLWFVGTLVPVIQLVQSGEQAMADRFSYIPSLGMAVLVVWGTYELIKRRQHRMMMSSLAGGAAVIVCFVLTQHQLGYWRDDETLFRHTLAVTKENYFAHKSLGDAFSEQGRFGEAMDQYQEAFRLNPQYADAHYNLGITLLKEGRIDEAINQFQEAIREKPNYADPHNNLGFCLDKKGQTDEAISQLQEAIRLKPDLAEAHYNLGTALGRKGQVDEAIHQFQEAVRLKPDYAEAHYNLGTALGMKGRIDEALIQYQEAVRLKPDYAEAHNNLGTILGRKGRVDEAIHQFQEAIRLKPDYAEARSNLARALEMKNAPASH